MSVYHGWDHDEMRHLGGVETATSDENTPSPKLASFTPINPTRASLQFVSPLKTLYETGVDCISYEHTHENIPEVPATQRKKRGAAQGNKGRAVSIAQVWEYRDDGDVAAQNQGADFETSFPKRRKSAPPKRNKSVPAQSNTLDQVWDQGDQNAALLQDPEHQGEQQGSQLTTPPDSGKQISKRAPPPKPYNAKFQPGPFKNPVITKPSMSCEDKGALTKPVTIHQGWTSTEEVVKSKFTGISKTTLDKLAAFRFKASADTHPPKRHRLASENLRMDKEQEHTDVTEMPPPPHSTDYGLITSDDSIFDEGYRIEQDPVEPSLPHSAEAERSQRARNDQTQGNDGFFNDSMWTFKTKDAAEHDTPQHPQAKLASGYGEAHQTSFWKNHSINSPPIQEPLVPPLGASQLETVQTPQQISDYNEPTSSETRELMGLVEEVQVRIQDNRPATDVSSTRRCFPSTEEERRERYFEDIQSCSKLQVGVGDQANPIDFSQAVANEANELSRLDTTNKDQKAEIPFTRVLDDVQVKRSNVDDPEIISRDVSNDFDLNEFGDDGLDDADLLAIASDPIVPETQPVAAKSQNNATGLLATRTCAFEPLKTVLGSSHPGLADLGLRAESPEVELGDECLLEEGFEEEDMMSLPEQLVGVMKNHQAPPSLQFAFGSEPMSGEVYDKSLQFSPPKTRPSSTSPRKTANRSHTNENSPDRVGYQTDLDSILVEGEDWSFIRTNDLEDSDAPLVFEPPFRSRPLNATQVTKGVIPLGPQKQRTKPSQAKIQQGTDIPSIFGSTLDDSHEYEPLRPFARPDFPDMVVDRCPILGISAQTFLRVCFRVGEMFREGARCHAVKQDGVIELFARVTFSSREPGTRKQNFQFADLWHDRPPFPRGVLANYKTTGLADSESRVFIGAEEELMARCVARLKKDEKNVTGWLLDIINIRPTDWEEIKWTKRIVSAGLLKSEKVDI